MRTNTLCILLLLLGFSLTAMPIQEMKKPTLDEEQLDALFSQSVQAFSDKLFFAADAQPKNRMISPLSVFLALGMTANGARGQTQDEILTLLTNASLLPSDLNQASLAYLKNTSKEVSIANSLWANEEFKLSTAFLSQVRKQYQATAKNLDFSSEKSTRTINDWVKDATKGAIDSIIDSVQPDMVLYLINAISFKDAWRNEFEVRATRPMAFHTKTGDVSAPFLNQEGYFQYLKANQASYLYLPYRNERYIMVAILPDEGIDMETFLGKQEKTGFSASLFSLHEQTNYENINLSFPKFESRFTDSLVDELTSLGMQRSFDASLADFSAMSASNTRETAIGEVLHKTFIRVDETGTEAAAVTAVMMKVTAMPPQQSLRLVFDRPFVYAILDLQHNIPLFMGVMNNPNP